MLFQEVGGRNWHGEIEGCRCAVFLDVELGVAQKELGDLENRKIAADLSQKEKIAHLQGKGEARFGCPN